MSKWRNQLAGGGMGAGIAIGVAIGAALGSGGYLAGGAGDDDEGDEGSGSPR